MEQKTYYAALLKTESGIEVVFPDLPECKIFIRDEDSPIGHGKETFLHAHVAGSDALCEWLSSVTLDKIPEEPLCKEQVNEMYPNAISIGEYVDYPPDPPPSIPKAEGGRYTGKPFRGTICNWQLHHLTIPGGEENQKLFREKFPDVLLDPERPGPLIFSGTVVDDPTGRFRPGWHMRSSYIVKIDREKGIIETENTFYKVKDEGNDVLPDLGNGILKIFY